MQELVRLAKDEKLIIVCTIHQPSTKVYNGFDQVMVLSQGREAYTGNVSEAIPYFAKIGFLCPPSTNPAEFFLDLVNSDFSDKQAVERILDTWEEQRAELSRHDNNKVLGNRKSQESMSSAKTGATTFPREMKIMFHRHALLILRDPILYIGRCVSFLLCNCFFSFIYWNARPLEQDQVVNKLWICIWYCAVSTNCKFLLQMEAIVYRPFIQTYVYSFLLMESVSNTSPYLFFSGSRGSICLEQ